MWNILGNLVALKLIILVSNNILINSVSGSATTYLWGFLGCQSFGCLSLFIQPIFLIKYTCLNQHTVDSWEGLKNAYFQQQKLHYRRLCCKTQGGQNPLPISAGLTSEEIKILWLLGNMLPGPISWRFSYTKSLTKGFLNKAFDLQEVPEPAEQPYVDIRLCSYRADWKLLSIIIPSPVILATLFFI